MKINVIDLIEIILILSYFIVDMTVTFVLRIYKYGINSFKAHRDHAYQNFCLKKNNHKNFNLLMFFYNFFFIIPIFFINSKFEIPIFIILSLCFLPPIIFVSKYSPLLNKN